MTEPSYPSRSEIDDAHALNPNPLVKFLRKSPAEFTREDIVAVVTEFNVQMINLNYVGADGRLKKLSFAIQGEDHLREVLDWGERVDGSSLIPYIDPGKSDLYVIPKFRTAFLNPFTEIPTLNLLCAYFDQEGNPLAIAPEFTVCKAHAALQERTGLRLYALGELEYYVRYEFAPDAHELFPSTPQRNYHESRPWTKFEEMNDEILQTLTAIGVRVKYGHSEVGAIAFGDGRRYEQYEIECNLEPLEDMADHLVIAKWVIRNVAYDYNVDVTFAPKLSVGHAGTGLHVHVALVDHDQNVMLEGAELSETARRAIGGLLKFAPSITAFGNTNPTSYLRLVPHQEAPTNVCWGDTNRSALVRVPLGWRALEPLSAKVNPFVREVVSCEGRQTVELRSPDGSANVHLLLAAIAVAVKWGLTHDEALALAEQGYVSVNIFAGENKDVQERLEQLPSSCVESARRLAEHADLYAEDDVFARGLIDGVRAALEDFDDAGLNEDLKRNRLKAEEYIRNFLHWG